MRVRALLLGLSLLGLAGCSHCFGGRTCGNAGCGEQSWWSKLTHRSQPTEYVASPAMMGAGDCGCAPTGNLAAEGEPILTAPQKLAPDAKKDGAGYAEPMPFTP